MYPLRFTGTQPKKVGLAERQKLCFLEPRTRRMGDADDLSTNPVFLELKQKYPKIYQLVQANCYTFCVPQQAALQGNKSFTEDFIST